MNCLSRSLVAMNNQSFASHTDQNDGADNAVTIKISTELLYELIKRKQVFVKDFCFDNPKDKELVRMLLLNTLTD
jgi:hypothetical protein